MAAGVVCDGVECIHEQTAQALALVVLGDANLLDVADGAAIMNEFLFGEDQASADDTTGVLNDQIVVGAFAASVHFVVALFELVLGHFRHPCQISQALYEALSIIILAEGPNLVAGRKGRCRVGPDERGGKQRGVGSGHGGGSTYLVWAVIKDLKMENQIVAPRGDSCSSCMRTASWAE